MVATMRHEQVRVGSRALPGELIVPPDAAGLVLFVHGSGSSRHSPRNQFVARVLNEHRLATLLFDLLTPSEADDVERVFDIELLAGRVEEALAWVDERPDLADLPIGLFGASTGAAAALCTAAQQPGHVSAVVSRGGRPDLAWRHLGAVVAPTLLVVGSLDRDVLDLNRGALARLRCSKRLEVVPGATHLFEEPGTLDAVAQLAGEWFHKHLSDGGGRP
jgi:pimeloyl-ACP methyl ester carboxylesterase